MPADQDEARLTRIRLPVVMRRGLLAPLRAAYPREGCGLLVGRLEGGAGDTVRITAVHPTANVHDSGRPDRFEVDPAVRIRLMRALRGGPDALVGHVHSHPDAPAVPSETDRHHAFEPDLIWLIVGLAGADDPSPELRAWAVVPAQTAPPTFRPLALETVS